MRLFSRTKPDQMALLQSRKVSLDKAEQEWLAAVNELFQTNYVTLAGAEAELVTQIRMAKDYE
jgi:hypothetical protein